jgi:hypothetical protein
VQLAFSFLWSRLGLLALTASLVAAGALGEPSSGAPTSFAAEDQDQNREFTMDFALETCTFSSTGSNPFFILRPGYRLVLKGREDGEDLQLVITVLNQTKTVSGVQTRVVEEKETKDGELVEISRNYFAICNQHNSVIYYGEDVDIYENGKIVSHDGAWLAGVNNARAGLMMPGIVLLEAKYFQEIAPRVAMDRAEIVSVSETVVTPAGRFTKVLKTEETTPLEPGATGFKYYARGIGLIQDGVLKLTCYGFSC